MNKNLLSVREIQKNDIDLITDYWLTADTTFLKGMGVDPDKLPGRDEWKKLLSEQLAQPIVEKKSYCIIWEVDNKSTGHSNINKIILGEEAFMHLHLWNTDVRKKGLGTAFIKLTLPFYFEKFRLEKLYSEPYALNPAPNKALKKAGFEFIKKYKTIPGWLNFEQEVNLWEMSYNQFKEAK
jgi:ribosomal-protein-alanine N-acetyltransferase